MTVTTRQVRRRRVSTATIGSNGRAKDRDSKRGKDCPDVVEHVSELTRERRAANARDLVKQITGWMHAQRPAWGIDALLTRPFATIEMALNVGVKTGRIEAGDAHRLTSALQTICRSSQNAVAMKSIDGICRAAMAARKRGLIKCGNGITKKRLEPA